MILSDELKEGSNFFVSALKGGEILREKRLSAITFVAVLCFLLTAPLFANTIFPNNDLSKDKIPENSEESILASPDPFVTFTGTITGVGIPCPAPGVFAEAVVGDSWTLTYTFDAATSDVDVNPTAGQYRNPITDMTLEIGSTTVSGTPGQAIPGGYSSLIFVNLVTSGFADYGVQIGLPDTSAWASVNLYDDTGTPFADDSLPLGMPIPLEAKFPTFRHFSLRAMGSTQICIEGTVEDVIVPSDYIIDYMIDTVDAYVSSGILKAGAGNSLTKKLVSAMDHIVRDNYHAASQKLGDFIDQVSALIRSRRLPVEEGEELIALAQKTIDLLVAS
ncbi:MAG: FIMAH domain-containing protein [Candidatus Thorarchaeota archaeon]|jgi:hypothetical protein